MNHTKSFMSSLSLSPSVFHIICLAGFISVDNDKLHPYLRCAASFIVPGTTVIVEVIRSNEANK